jgi:chromosome partitioning protein
MQSLVIAAAKGGCGKTTTATNLATTLVCERERRVLLVDLDPDADATRFWGQSTSDGLVVVQAEEACLGEVAVPTGVGGLDLVPGCPALKTSALRAAQNPMLLDWVSQALTRLSGYEAVIFDTPAGFGLDATSAALATRRMLVATLLEAGDQASLAGFLQGLRPLTNRGVHVAGVLPCRYDRRRKTPTANLQALCDVYGSLVLGPVPDRAELGELASAHGEPLARYHPRSAALPAYRNVLDQLFPMENR